MEENELRTLIDDIFDSYNLKDEKLMKHAKRIGKALGFYNELKLDENKYTFLYLFYHISSFTGSISFAQLDYLRTLLNLEYFATDDLMEIMEENIQYEDIKDSLFDYLARSSENPHTLKNVLDSIMIFIHFAPYPTITYSTYELCKNIMQGNEIN